MLVFTHLNLAYLATPKTGSTAVEMALRSQADIVFRGRRKHITAKRFHRRIGPVLNDTFGTQIETVAMIRDPVDQLRSWYRYRARPGGKKSMSTAHLTFDAFVTALLSDTPPACAQIGSQHNFLTGGGTVLVTHLFAYERWDIFQEFLNQRFGKDIPMRRKNTSPPLPAPVSPAVEAALRQARTPDFDLHQRVMTAGGYLERAEA